jgi:hypothetical protein
MKQQFYGRILGKNGRCKGKGEWTRGITTYDERTIETDYFTSI